MPTKEYYFNNKQYYSYDDTVVVFDDNDASIRLRKKNAAGNWTPSADGKYDVSGTIILPNFRADAITELFALEHTTSGSGTIDYQFSVDNGINWKYVSASGTWTTSATEFSSLVDIDGNLGYLTLGYPRQVRIKARLRPVNNIYGNTITPVLESVFLHYEHNASYLKDILETFSIFTKQHLAVRLESRINVVSGTSEHVLHIPEGSSLINVESVYNLTTDSSRQVNIYSSCNVASGTVSVVPQVSGTMLVTHQNTLPIFLGADPEFYDSQVPSILIKENFEEEDKETRYGDDLYEISISRLQARVRPHPSKHETDIVFRCQDHSQQRSAFLADAVKKLYESHQILYSVGTGQVIKIRSIDSVRTVGEFSNWKDVGIKVVGMHDINKQEFFQDSVGSVLPSSTEFVGSGTKYDTVPLIVEDGITFRMHSLIVS